MMRKFLKRTLAAVLVIFAIAVMCGCSSTQAPAAGTQEVITTEMQTEESQRSSNDDLTGEEISQKLEEIEESEYSWDSPFHIRPYLW